MFRNKFERRSKEVRLNNGAAGTRETSSRIRMYTARRLEKRRRLRNNVFEMMAFDPEIIHVVAKNAASCSSRAFPEFPDQLETVPPARRQLCATSPSDSLA